jgi:cell division septation protein DedD
MESKVGKRAIGTMLAIGVAAVVLTGCTSATGEAPDPASSDITSEATERQASGSQDRIRVCVQNNTSRNLEYYFEESAVDDQQEPLSRQWGTMGPSAFACGASKNAGRLTNYVDFVYKNSADRLIHVQLHNGSAPLVFAVYYVRSDETRDLLRVSTALGSPYQGVADGKVFDVMVGPSARTFDKITAIPVDVRISDAP